MSLPFGIPIKRLSMIKAKTTLLPTYTIRDLQAIQEFESHSWHSRSLSAGFFYCIPTS